MRVCVYCKSRYQAGSGVTFHKFPSDSTTLKLWLRNMKFGNWVPNINSHLCSRHFTEDSVIRHVSRTQLKKDSVPTIFTDSDVIIPETNKEEADLMNYECVKKQTDDMNLETFTKKEPSASYNTEQNETPKRTRSYAETCESVNHDHRYVNNLVSSNRAIQRLQKALKRSQIRGKTLAQHVKVLKIRVSSLKTVVKELGKTKLVTDDCDHESNQYLPATTKPAPTSLAKSSRKKNVAVRGKKLVSDIDNKSATEIQVDHVASPLSDADDQPDTETEATYLNIEYDYQSDTDSYVLPEAPSEDSYFPGPKNFSWQKPNEVVPILADDFETEAVVDNLSMYCDVGEHGSLLSEQLDEKPIGDPVSPAPDAVFRCNVCDTIITGFRYTCVQCSDLDLCGACEADSEHHHHYVLRVPADKHVGEVQLVLATIRRHLMRKLDPITQHDQEQDEALSFKSEVKSEAEDYGDNDNNCHYSDDYDDDTKNKSLEDDEIKRSSSPAPPHGNIVEEIHYVDKEDEKPREEYGEARGEPKPTKLIYLKRADFMKIKERGLPWVRILDPNKVPSVGMPDAQPQAKEAVVLSEVSAETRPRVRHANARPQRKLRRVQQVMKQKELRTKIMKALDINEDPLSQVEIVEMQTNLIDAEQFDSKIIATGAQRDIEPGVRPEATARDEQSNICLPDAHRAKPKCSVKLKKSKSLVLKNAGTKLVVSVTSDSGDSRTTLPTTRKHKAGKRTILIEQPESGDTGHAEPEKKRCLSPDSCDLETDHVMPDSSQAVKNT